MALFKPFTSLSRFAFLIAIGSTLPCSGSYVYAAQGAGGSEPATSLSSASDGSQRFQLIGPLTVDDRYLGDIDIEVDVSGRGRVDSTRLAELLEPLLSPEMHEKLTPSDERERFVPFRQVSVGGMEVSYDPATLGVVVNLPASLRDKNMVSLSGLAPPDPKQAVQPASAGGGVQLFGQETYMYEDDNFGDNTVGRVEGFLTLGGFDGISLTGAMDYSQQSGNGLELDRWTLTKDFFGSAIRLQGGYVLPATVGFQSSAVLEGVGLSRRYQDIRPFQNIRPSGRQSITLERASTVEVYVNGQMVQTLQLPAGPYDFDDFPVTEGFNDVQLIVRDVTGRKEVFDWSVLYSPIILAPGVTDFGAWLGRPSAKTGANKPLFSGYLLRGFRLGTFGTNLQASEYGYQLGSNTVMASGDNYLSLTVSWGSNHDGNTQGGAVAIDAQTELSLLMEDDLRLRMQAEAYQEDFFDPLLNEADNRNEWQSAVSASYKLDYRTYFTLGGQAENPQNEAGLASSFNAGIIHKLGEVRLSAFASHRVSGDNSSDTSFRVGFTIPLGITGNMTVRNDSRTSRTEIEASRYRQSLEPDWSARARLGRDPQHRDAAFEATRYGQRMFLSVDHNSIFPSDSNADSQHRSSLRASTFLGFADTNLGWGREGLGGFTIVRTHPSLDDRDARLKQSGQIMFQRDGLGPGLVPVTRSYTETRQELFVDALPYGYSLPETDRKIFPGFANAYSITIGTDAFRSVSGILKTHDGEPAALLVGRFVPENDDYPGIDFFTAQNGQFFAVGLAEGSYKVVIDNEVCGEFEIKAGGESLVDIGEIRLDAR